MNIENQPTMEQPVTDKAVANKAVADKAVADKAAVAKLRLAARTPSPLRNGQVPIHPVIYPIGVALWSSYFRIGGLKVVGRENVPLTGPLIIAANHASLLDPPLLGVASPRVFAIMAKQELFEQKFAGMRVLNRLIRGLGAFPVQREKADRKALRHAMQVLQGGQAVALFPEGTRTPDGRLGPAEPGLGMIAHSTKAPIIPVYLKGTEQALSKVRPGFRLIHPEVHFGKPLDLTEEYARRGGRDTLEAIGARVMEAIAELAAGAGP
jgi:1-acyl-sn-glycerol-3-phosphate acyltransferase